MHYTSLGPTSKNGTDFYQNEELSTVERQTQNSEWTSILGFHRASLLSVTFINQLMHSIIKIMDVKIYIIQDLKDTH